MGAAPLFLFVVGEGGGEKFFAPTLWSGRLDIAGAPDALFPGSSPGQALTFSRREKGPEGKVVGIVRLRCLRGEGGLEARGRLGQGFLLGVELEEAEEAVDSAVVTRDFDVRARFLEAFAVRFALVA